MARKVTHLYISIQPTQSNEIDIEKIIQVVDKDLGLEEDNDGVGWFETAAGAISMPADRTFSSGWFAHYMTKREIPGITDDTIDFAYRLAQLLRIEGIGSSCQVSVTITFDPFKHAAMQIAYTR